MRLRPNPEFVRRHLFVAVLMAAMGGWFGYDGYVNYPSQDDAFFADRHLERENAIRRQKEFMLLALAASALVGGHLWAVTRFRFEFDETTFTWRGERKAIADVREIDRSQWAKKGILKVDGIKLDAWHHLGVKEFESKLRES